ncbi:MAG: phosphatase PAP2 family protein, partial [Gemmatimonadales bacterium]|nr:phosphatase PAP2 family protein [Gemmatimonadales bacterium]
MGRGRPDDLLQDEPAMPSGHTAMAFALATSLADDINRPWASVGLYTMAGAVGWSRINDDRHWLSDVAAGAVLGIASAKFASGKWTIFGLRAPSVLAGPEGVG